MKLAIFALGIFVFAALAGLLVALGLLVAAMMMALCAVMCGYALGNEYAYSKYERK